MHVCRLTFCVLALSVLLSQGVQRPGKLGEHENVREIENGLKKLGNFQKTSQGIFLEYRITGQVYKILNSFLSC